MHSGLGSILCMAAVPKKRLREAKNCAAKTLSKIEIIL
jgi:hypothetical protein